MEVCDDAAARPSGGGEGPIMSGTLTLHIPSDEEGPVHYLDEAGNWHTGNATPTSVRDSGEAEEEDWENEEEEEDADDDEDTVDT